MRIDAAPAYLVASRLREICLAETCEQRSDDHHGAAQERAFANELFAEYIVPVYGIRPEGVAALGETADLHAHILEHEDKVFYVEYFRNIRNDHLLIGKQYGADDLQRLVLGTLGSDFTAQSVPAFYYE